MERESFEDETIAGLMNEHFVNIKVDREERPDVDQIYMQAVQSMTGHGGWPMTVFLTPDGVPFYGGTYFPPTDRHGMPAFPRLLEAVAEAYRSRRGEVVESGRQLVEQMRQSERLRQSASLLDRGDPVRRLSGHVAGVRRARRRLRAGAEVPAAHELGVHAALLEAQRRMHARSTWRDSRSTGWREGGMYDQLGGGFHRYSVDGHWLVPHFEKMLYDNAPARLAVPPRVARHRRAEYRRVTEETLDYVLREMTHPAGGFYPPQDADSEGVEGKFFVWSPEEIRAALPDAEMADSVLAYWGVADGPNFEGHSILHVPRAPEDVAQRLGLSQGRLAELVAASRKHSLRAPGAAYSPGPGRQGARIMERPGPGGLR